LLRVTANVTKHTVMIPVLIKVVLKLCDVKNIHLYYVNIFVRKKKKENQFAKVRLGMVYNKTIFHCKRSKL